jgi:hypothetical protein
MSDLVNIIIPIYAAVVQYSIRRTSAVLHVLNLESHSIALVSLMFCRESKVSQEGHTLEQPG